MPPSGPVADGPFGGDPVDGSQSTVQLRAFTVPGVYTYHSTRTGASGQIVVSTTYTATPSSR